MCILKDSIIINQIEFQAVYANVVLNKMNLKKINWFVFNLIKNSHDRINKHALNSLSIKLW